LPQISGSNKPNPALVNVASGVYVQEGFINLDYHMILQLLPVYPFLKPFLSDKKRKSFEQYLEARRKSSLHNHDCRRPLPFPDGSIDHILCSHFLEHVYPKEAVKIIRDFHRVLKPRGTLHAIVPDLRAEVNRYIKDVSSKDAANDFMDSLIISGRTPPSFSIRWREFLGNFGHLHRWMYDETSFRDLIESCGFQILSQNESPSKNFRIEDEDQVNLFARRI
jgi:ubiquinone/menaquinone biosynthesis C-methylase UbiE